MEEIYEDMTIDELNVDGKIKEALKKSGFKYVRQLENKSIGRIYEVTSLGRKYIEQLTEQLYLLGVELKDERDDTDTKNRFEKWREEMALKKSKKESSQSVDIYQNDKDSEDKDKEVRNSEDNKGERD